MAGNPLAGLLGRTIGPYRIEARIGRGGMGEVYRAVDARLNRVVAIKGILGPDALDPRMRERFERETRLASRVNHPYVATVYEVVEHDGALLLVMEFIDGRPLGDALEDEYDHSARHRLPEIALEIAEALAAIHAAGLVHRDLKPNNIMLTKDGHVKVLDFGVARAIAPSEVGDATATVLTTTGVVVGTLNYMSPEQLRSGPVDGRSDLFSFGVILYQAVTGRHPFLRGSPMETGSAILSAPPGDPGDAKPLAASGPMRHVVMRLLEKNPDDRYPTAEALAEDLRALVRGTAVKAAVKARRKSTAKVSLVLGLALGVVGLGAAAWHKWGSALTAARSAPSVAPVAVVPFADRTQDTAGGFRGEMLADLLDAALNESQAVRALDLARVREIVASLPATASATDRAAAFGRNASARWVISGTIYRDGESLVATAELRDARRPRDEAAKVGPVTAGGVAALADLMRPKLLDVLAPGRKEAADPRLAAELASIPDAARSLEIEARTKIRAMRFEEAESLLKKATEIEPRFALAEARLAEVLDLKGFGTKASEAATRAEQLIATRGDAYGERTKLEVQATAARVRGDAKQEAETRKGIAARYPEEPAAHLAFAETLRRGGDAATALAETDRAVAIDPSDPRAEIERARSLTVLKRWDDATAALDRAAKVFGQTQNAAGAADVAHARGDLAFRRGDSATAAGLFKQAADAFRSAGLDVRAAYEQKAVGDMELAQGKLAAADEAYRPALATFRAVGDKRSVVRTLSGLGAQLYVKGDYAAAEAPLREACATAQELDNDSLLLVPQYNLASLLNFTGRVAEADAAAQSVVEVARKLKNRDYERKARGLLADNQYQAGLLDEAVARYDELIRLESGPGAEPDKLEPALANLAEVLEAKGAWGRALDVIHRAVEIDSRRQDAASEAYALIRRGRVRALLADFDGSLADLNRASELVRQSGADLEDARRRIVLARLLLAVARGTWAEGAATAGEALREAKGSASVALEAPALVFASVCSRELRRGDEAIELARRALEHPKVLPHERLMARVALARAMAVTKQVKNAIRESRRAYQEATLLGSPIAIASAAAAVLEVDGAAADAPQVRSRGSRAARSLLEGVPASHREAVRGRRDLDVVMRTFAPGPTR